MTFLNLHLVAATLALAAQQPDCARPITTPGERRVFTNADLERIASCRRQSDPSPGPDVPTAADTGPTSGRRGSRPEAAAGADKDARRTEEALEADWRARWRSVDQRVRRLRREAEEFRLEANEAPRDPKKKPTGRKSPQVLLRRASALEAEAREIEDELQTQARREGALPGWLRAR